MAGAFERRLRRGLLFYNNSLSEDPSLKEDLSHTLSDVIHGHMTHSPTLKGTALPH